MKKLLLLITILFSTIANAGIDNFTGENVTTSYLYSENSGGMLAAVTINGKTSIQFDPGDSYICANSWDKLGFGNVYIDYKFGKGGTHNNQIFETKGRLSSSRKTIFFNENINNYFLKEFKKAETFSIRYIAGCGGGGTSTFNILKKEPEQLAPQEEIEKLLNQLQTSYSKNLKLRFEMNMEFLPPASMGGCQVTIVYGVGNLTDCKSGTNPEWKEAVKKSVLTMYKKDQVPSVPDKAVKMTFWAN